MNFGWYFSKELSPSDILVDEFADSKFTVNKWTSFAREIVQNSLDAQDDTTKPVKVIFDINTSLRINDIPGDFRIRLSSLEPTVVNSEYVKKLLKYEKLCRNSEKM